MVFPTKRWLLVALIPLLAGFAVGSPLLLELGEGAVSGPGEYRGYSAALYDEWVRTSRYVETRDGTRLAVDLYRPAEGGEPVTRALPVIWSHERYHRAGIQNGKLTTPVDRWARLRKFIQHGYVLGVVDARGTGASFGSRRGPFSQEETLDAYDITEWFAAREFCDGNVGMMGRSYSGIAQDMAASSKPPHLKAVFPEMAMFDLYSTAFSGGIFRKDFVTSWSTITRRVDVRVPAPGVDGDSSGVLLEQAIAEHRENVSALELFSELRFRDSRDPESGRALHVSRSPSSYVKEINESGVAIYHLAGWHDVWTRDALLWFANLRVPQRLIIGPWSHTDAKKFSRFAEQLRWFDYWLKGVDNGIMDQAPIHYYTLGAKPGEEWRATDTWPLPDEQSTDFYLSPDASGSLPSAHDGSLTEEAPPVGRTDYTVDDSTTSGRATRWVNGYGGAPLRYPDMTANDKKALTFTTPPLGADFEVTGHPVVRIWITCSVPDVDVVAYLEEVDRSGVSHYVTEGVLRASHRAVGEPPWNHLGLPYHRSFAEDVVDLPAEPVELAFDLLPTSNVFDSGHRLRLTLAAADRDNLETREVTPSPVLSVHFGARHPSAVTLPVIPAGAERDLVAIPTGQRRWSRKQTAVFAGSLVLLALALVLFDGVRSRKSFTA